MRTLAVASIKGGVGKTSTAVNLAAAAVDAGDRALVWDLDPQGAATWCLGVGTRVPGGGRTLVHRDTDVAAATVSTRAGIDVLPADFSLRYLDLELSEAGRPKRRLRRVVRKLEADYDTILIDCPPGMTLVIESSLRAADAVLVPVVPSSLPMRTVAQLQSFVAAEKRLRNLRVLPFLSMIDRRRATHRRLVEELASDATGLLPTPIPLSVDIETIGVHRGPVSSYAPRSKAVPAYRAMWRDVLAALEASSERRP